MSATFSAAEHTVINVGEEENPRLISCVKASQGFNWNQGTHALRSYTMLYTPGVHQRLVANASLIIEIFLPSYADYHFDDLERRQDPVEDIIVTEDEVRKMFPS